MLGIHVDKKSIYGPCDEARFIRKAITLSRGMEVPLPILFGRRNLGWIVGKRNSPLVWKSRPMSPAEAAGFPTLASIQNAAKNGQVWTTFFSKGVSPGAGQWYDSWPASGSPPPGSYTGAAFTSVSFDNTTPGALYLGGNVTPFTRYLLATQASISGTAAVVAIIYDRVLTYEACTFNASVLQNFTNSTPALRWISVGQPGLQVTITTTPAGTGATAANLTQLSYTNQNGSAGIAAPCSTPVLPIAGSASTASPFGCQVICPAFTAAANAAVPTIALATPDTGVRLLTSYTTSAANTGSMCFLLHRPLGFLMMQTNDVQFETDYVYQRLNLGLVYDNACLAFLFFANTGTVSSFQGHSRFVWN
jgi:hypothetical protein